MRGAMLECVIVNVVGFISLWIRQGHMLTMYTKLTLQPINII